MNRATVVFRFPGPQRFNIWLLGTTSELYHRFLACVRSEGPRPTGHLWPPPSPGYFRIVLCAPCHTSSHIANSQQAQAPRPKSVTAFDCQFGDLPSFDEKDPCTAHLVFLFIFISNLLRSSIPKTTQTTHKSWTNRLGGPILQTTNINIYINPPQRNRTHSHAHTSNHHGATDRSTGLSRRQCHGSLLANRVA